MLYSGSNRRLSHGALADKAATPLVPTAVFLKDPKEFRILDKPMAHPDR